MSNYEKKSSLNALISNSAQESARAYQRENLNIRRKMEEDFFNQALDYRNFVFAPEGYEGPVLALYIGLVPYFSGLLFLYLFVARASYEYFLQFNLTSFFVIWAIGYEVCAVSLLIVIFLAWVNHLRNRVNKEQVRKKSSKVFGK
ncbi:MAG: hypothetical protein PHO27_11375 [Sulfuricurvum sp.]|nr:hypothetical protein [Sulfuricurvum sp.]